MRVASALLLVAVIAASGCSPSGGGEVEGPVSVYVSLPLTGPRSADGRDAADGARLALEQAKGRAGDLEVRASFLDDAKGRPWDPVRVGENARRAAQDSSAVAYIGELDSEPTRTSVPIINDAGLVQVSPSAGAVDLTRAAAGYPDTPERYQPSGQPSFARIVPADDLQVRAAASWAAELSATRVSARSDGTVFDELSAEEFADDAQELGLAVVPADGSAELRFSTRSPAGFELREPDPPDQGFAVAPTVEPTRLPGKQFTAEFESRFDRAPGPYAAYGYEAMALVLQAIEDAGRSADGFRDAVRQGVIGGERRESVLGPYSITREGDSTVCAVQRYRVGASLQRPLGAPCPPR